MLEVAPDLWMLDTLLGGVPGLTAAYLAVGDEPVLVDTGAQTSAATVARALAAKGIGSDDLAVILLTHVHLDHCGAAGDLAARFPRARVLVHPRGAPHLVAPERLVSGSAAVYGARTGLYGGLAPIDEGRIDVTDDGHVVMAGPGRGLRVIHAPGHARHHMAVLDEASGTLIAADALGVRFAGGGLHPAIPPPEYDPDASATTLDRLRGLGSTACFISHFGDVGTPDAMLRTASEANARIAREGRALPPSQRADPDAVAAAVERAWPVAPSRASPEAIARWELTGWHANNPPGVAAWLAREARLANGGPTV